MILVPIRFVPLPNEIVFWHQMLVLDSSYSTSIRVNNKLISLTPLQYILDRLTDPELFLGMLTTDEGITAFCYQSVIASEFYRRRISSNFPYGKFKKGVQYQEKSYEKIQKEIDLWDSLLDLLEEVHEINQLPFDPAYSLNALIRESALINFYIIHGNVTGGIVKYKEFIQAQNKILQNLDNPFDISKYPILRTKQRSIKEKDRKKKIENIYNQEQVKETKKYVDMITTLAEQDKAFSKKFSRFTKARMALCTSWFQEKDEDFRVRVFCNGKEIGKGRTKGS